MHAAIAIMAALLRRERDRRGRVPRRLGRRRRASLMSLYVDEYLATGTEPGPGPRHPHRPLRLLRHLRLRRRPVALGRRHRARTSARNLCRALELEQYADAPDRRRSPGRDPRRLRRGLRAPATATTGSPSSARPTPASRRCYTVAELVDDPQFARAASSSRPSTPTEGHFRQTGPVLAGTTAARRSLPRSATARSPTPTTCWRAAGYDADTHRRALQPKRSDRMSEQTMTDDDCRPRSRPGSASTSTRTTASSRSSAATSSPRCASVENGNPLYWDEKVADELTGGPIAPPTMISVWFRPHHWAPGRRRRAGAPLQVHFDLKETLDLPEAVMTDNTIIFDEPVRPGDVLSHHQVLRSVSEPKTTKLGTGRFWVDRRRVPQPGRRARRHRDLHRLRLPAATSDDRDMSPLTSTEVSRRATTLPELAYDVTRHHRRARRAGQPRLAARCTTTTSSPPSATARRTSSSTRRTRRPGSSATSPTGPAPRAGSAG